MAGEIIPILIIAVGAYAASNSKKQEAQPAPVVQVDTSVKKGLYPTATAPHSAAAMEYNSGVGDRQYNTSALDRIFSGMVQDCSMDQQTMLTVNQFASGKLGELGALSKSPAYPVTQTDKGGEVWQGRLMPVNGTYSGLNVAYVFSYKASDGVKLKYGMMLTGDTSEVTSKLLDKMSSGTYDKFNVNPMADKQMVQLTCSV